MGANIKLNLGGGNTVIDGWINIDAKTGGDVLSLTEYQDNSVDEARASHILEHFGFADVSKALSEWYRVLKPGSRLRVAVPDIGKISLSSSPLKFYYMYGGQVDENDFHKTGFSNETLRSNMEQAGFIGVTEWDEDGVGDTACKDISLRMECYKPQEEKAQDFIDVKIQGVMSLPRLAFTDSWGCIYDALSPFRIKMTRYTGAYWEHGIQNVFEDCVENGVDWILSFDYDTVFTSEQLDIMLGEFGNNPHIDALSAMQSKRAQDTPLLTVKDDDGVNMSGINVTGEPLRVNTAHFGLTLIRVDALKKMDKPWFMSVPDSSGGWRGDDRVDADIYFWKKWEAVGNTAYVSTNARIGHLETLVSSFDADMTHKIEPYNDWKESNHT